MARSCASPDRKPSNLSTFNPLSAPLASFLGVENFETRENVGTAAQTLQQFGL